MLEQNLENREEKRAFVRFLALAVLVLALMVASAAPVSAVEPLSQDDITLLLIGGASQQKMVTLVEQRGVDFQLTPQLIEKFHKLGATSVLIDAIVKSNRTQAARRASQPVEPPSPPPPSGVPSQGGPELPGLGSSSGPQVTTIPVTSAANGASSSQGQASGNTHPAAKPASTASTNSGPTPILSNPSPARIQQIIQAFAAKEEQFKEARNNYTYHQINIAETLNADGKVDGRWQQDWDILFNDQGKRIVRITYAPVSTLQRVSITEQDIDGFRNIQPFVLTTADLPEYEITYLGHVRVDYLTAYVFSVRPKKIRKGHQYFMGQVWVDDRDLQIVKAQGRNVPEVTTGKKQNLFPHFTTWRQQIDGKYWFPTFTRADDTLYFSSGPVRIREIVRYTDYKQFRATSRILSISPETPQPNKPAPKK